MAQPNLLLIEAMRKYQPVLRVPRTKKWLTKLADKVQRRRERQCMQ